MIFFSPLHRDKNQFYLDYVFILLKISEFKETLEGLMDVDTDRAHSL